MSKNIKMRLVGHALLIALIARFSLLSNVVSLAFHVGGEGARQEHMAGDNFEDDLDRFVNGQLEPPLQSRDNWVASEFPTDDSSLDSDQSSHHLSKLAEPTNGLVSHSIAVPQQFEGSSSSPSALLPAATHNLEADMDHFWLSLEPLESPPHSKRLRITPEFLGDFDEISAPILENPASPPRNPFAFDLTDPPTHNLTHPVVIRDLVAAQEAVARVKLTQPGPPVEVALPTAHPNTIRKFNQNGAVAANNHIHDRLENSRLERPLSPVILSSKEQYQIRVDAEVETSVARYDGMLSDSWFRQLISVEWQWQWDNPLPQNSAPFKQFNDKLERKMKELKEMPLPKWQRVSNMVPKHPIIMVPKSRGVEGPQNVFIRLANLQGMPQARSIKLPSIQNDILSIVKRLILYHRMGNSSNIWPRLLGQEAAISVDHLLNWLFGMIFEETDGSLPLLGSVQMVFPASEERARMFGALQKYLSQVLVIPGPTWGKDNHKPSLIILYAWYISSVEKHNPDTASHLHPEPFWRAIYSILLENNPPHQLKYLNSI